MKCPRCSGVLLHPTSLPGPYGIGGLGVEAFRFADFLAAAGQRIWQVLPLGPTGYGDSPYQSFSTFAGNPLLISPERLIQDGILNESDLADKPNFPERVDYGAVITWKRALLERARQRFFARDNELRREYEGFCAHEAAWLDDFALFMAAKEARGHALWTTWEGPLARREPHALEAARHAHADTIATHKLGQFLFFRQWRALREYCAARNIALMGDIPIYVAHDSADVWANPELFFLDESGAPEVVAGVPPDYFSATGQLWGNPIYRWNLMAQRGFDWWIRRIHELLRLVDYVRLDHFRGFEDYWEVPGDAETAERGRWAEGPRDALFEALQRALGNELPILAENLGIITPEVEALRKRFNLPGMAVLQFGFGHDAASSGLPIHAITPDTAAYTGTHDNDTLLGWWADKQADTAFVEYLKAYLDTDGTEFNWVCIRRLMASTANIVIFPLQDLLGLGKEGRMNTPGNPAGNWQWRYSEGALLPNIAERLRRLTEIYGRAL